MKNSSIDRILYLLNLLNNQDCTKNYIVEEFLKLENQITKPSVNNYINELKDNGFDIEILKNKNSNVYHLEKEIKKLKFSNVEIKNLNEIKKILVAQKDYDKIRKFIRILYKFVLNIEDDEIASDFFDFGYYSSINWSLVRQLEKHCENRNLIEIDYVLPAGTNKKISIYALDIHVAQWSDRLYLWGVFENAKQISYLPVDRIFMVTKVKKENCKIKLEFDSVSYKISRNLFEEIELDKEEKLVNLTNEYAIIERNANDEFYIVQRLLSFCPDVYDISNKRIKNLVFEKLQQMRILYEKEYE